MYGWNHYQGFNIMFHGLTIAAESALMLSRDYGYLDLLRSQINVLLDNAIAREDGQLLVPTRYGKNGWHEPAPTPFQFTGPQPMRIEELAHLYHASMSPEDYALIDRVRDGDVERDWNHVPVESEKNAGDSELPRLQYYEGKNPDWPVKALGADYALSLSAYEKIKNESDDFETIIKENTQPDNPVFTKGLTQVTMGAPQAVYNGGLLRATVRYFDQDRGATRPAAGRRRPGRQAGPRRRWHPVGESEQARDAKPDRSGPAPSVNTRSQRLPTAGRWFLSMPSTSPSDYRLRRRFEWKPECVDSQMIQATPSPGTGTQYRCRSSDSTTRCADVSTGRFSRSRQSKAGCWAEHPIETTWGGTKSAKLG